LTFIRGDKKYHIAAKKGQCNRTTNCSEIRGGSMQTFFFWPIPFISSQTDKKIFELERDVFKYKGLSYMLEYRPTYLKF